MKKIAIVEFESQLRALKKAAGSLNDIEIYSLNPDMWTILDGEGVAYQKILDEFIQEDWKKILVWTRETALTWFDHPILKDLLTVRGVNLGNAILSDFRHAFLQITTSMCIARKIIAKSNNNTQFVIFRELAASKRSFFGKPERQDSINYILEELGKQAGRQINLVWYDNPSKRKIGWRQILRDFATDIYSIFSYQALKSVPSIVSFGGANHLELFWKEFQRRGISFYIFDSTFHASFYRKAKELNVPYIVQGKWTRFFFAEAFKNEWQKFQRNLALLPGQIREMGIFIFDGLDISDFINMHFEGATQEFKNRVDSILFSEYLINNRKTLSLLLDEDTSYKRIYATTFVANQKPVFVVSHGVTGADFQISPDIKKATHGQYFTNSEFEKERYCTMGWDPEKLLVVGVSRYDQIFHLKQKPKPIHPKKIILYCPHRLSEKKTRAFGVSTPGYVTYQNTSHLIKATRGLECELWIKPHADAGDIPMWNKFANQNSAGHIRVFSPSTNIFKLISQSDLLVTTFSSVIVEGLLFDIPVITINFTGRPDIQPYASYGVTRGVYDPGQLRKTIQECLSDDGVIASLRDARQKHFSYFCGFCDGNNTRRSVDLILDSITKKESVHENQKSSYVH